MAVEHHVEARAYIALDDLLRLRHRATGFSFLPKQPVHSLLAGRHASRLRGRELEFEELRRYYEGDDVRAIGDPVHDVQYVLQRPR